MKGDHIGILGKSGAGKTTLINLILGLTMPREGKINCDNMEIHKNINSWFKLISYVPQTIYLNDDTIENNITFSSTSKKLDKKKLNKAISISMLEDTLKSIDNGLKTLVGENALRLSGGQRQRLGIARAIYNDQPIIILDEATNALMFKQNIIIDKFS